MNETFDYKQHGKKIIEVRRDYDERKKTSAANLGDFMKTLVAKGILSAQDIKQAVRETEDEYADEIVEKIDKAAEWTAKKIMVKKK